MRIKLPGVQAKKKQGICFKISCSMLSLMEDGVYTFIFYIVFQGS